MKSSIYLVCLLFLAFGWTYSQPQTQTQISKRILIIHSYHTGLRWTDDIARGIAAVFATETNLILDVHTEYMDTKNYYSPEYFTDLETYLGFKLTNQIYDVIITSDDDAFRYALRKRNTLFTNTPIVFCGVNYFDSNLVSNLNRITGIEENYDLIATIDMMLNVHPKVKELMVINDRTTNGLGHRKRVEAIIPHYQGRLNFTIVDDISYYGLLEKVRLLSNNTVILLLSFNRDKEGNMFSYPGICPQLSAVSPVPVYSIWDFYMNAGIVGGKLNSGYSQGMTAGQLALEILNGKPIDENDIIKDSPNKFMFDYKQIERFGISLSALPQDSVIINKPSLFNSRILFPLLIALGLLGLAVCVILVLLYINKLTKKAYLHSENRYRKLAEATFEGIIIHDNGVMIDVNRRLSEMTGYSQEELYGMNVLKLIHPTQQKEAAEKINSNYEKPYEIQFMRRDGTVFWTETCGKTVANGELTLRVVAVRDISIQKELKESMRRWFLFEQVTTTILTRFVEITDVDWVINNSLADIGKFAKADRAYLFLYSVDGETMDNTHEWCSTSVEPQIDNLKNIPRSALSWWRDRVDEGNLLEIEDVLKLPSEASSEKETLSAQNIKSLVAIPLKIDEKAIGFIGFDNTQTVGRWPDDCIALLRLFGEVVAKVISKNYQH